MFSFKNAHLHLKCNDDIIKTNNLNKNIIITLNLVKTLF